jgi:microcystin-dependent protein
MDEYLGVIKIFGFNFTPNGWMMCQGQLLPISQNAALFSLLGTTYGGDGRTTFALPDLRGRVPIGMGQGPGLSNYTPGQTGGTESVTLLATQLPSHNHSLQGYSTAGTTASPAGALSANSGSLDPEYSQSGTLTTMSTQAIGNTGNNQPHSNLQPYIAFNYCICTNGLYPSRS